MNFGFSSAATERGPWAGVAFDPASLMGIAGVASGALGYLGATSAANTQASAARDAAGLAAGNLATTRADLAPWRMAGGNALTDLSSRLPGLSSPITMDQASLEATPGYQFTLDQGLKSVQNAAAAKGLGISGAALKGAARFATGLADSTYQNRFGNELASRQNSYNMLSGVSGMGQNAAAMTGTLGAQNTAAVNAANLGGATATASGMVGGTNALSNALTGGVNNYMNYDLLSRLVAQRNGASQPMPTTAPANFGRYT